jgi:integrase
MRVSELEQLAWGDVDEQDGRWRVSQPKARSTKRPTASTCLERSPDGWIVVLNEDLGDEDFQSAVAHEIARLELGIRPPISSPTPRRTRTTPLNSSATGASRA